MADTALCGGNIGHYEDIGVGYGNMCSRTDDQGQFVISNTQTSHLRELGNEHFSLTTGFVVDDNIVISEGETEASSESMTYATLSQLHPKIRAVVYIHGEARWGALKDRVPTTDAGVACSTPAMALKLDRLLNHTDFRQTGIALMAGHESGLISTGGNVQEAAEQLPFFLTNGIETR